MLKCCFTVSESLCTSSLRIHVARRLVSNQKVEPCAACDIAYGVVVLHGTCDGFHLAIKQAPSMCTTAEPAGQLDACYNAIMLHYDGQISCPHHSYLMMLNVGSRCRLRAADCMHYCTTTTTQLQTSVMFSFTTVHIQQRDACFAGRS